MAFAALVSPATVTLGQSAAALSRPNIVFIIADDLASWAIGAYGGPHAHTPHLDRLAREGVLFENAFAVSAVCSPARAALLTGRYPSEAEVLDFRDVSRIREMFTWPHMLQNEGYRTALIGSWSASGLEKGDNLPSERGYHEYAGVISGGTKSGDPTIGYFNFGDKRGSVNYEDVPGIQYTDELQTDLALDFIRRAKDSSQPFFISLNLRSPHANTIFPRDFKLPYDDRSWLPQREDDFSWWNRLPDEELTLPEQDFPNLDAVRVRRMLREYLAATHSIDRNVGRLLAALQDPNGDGRTDDSIAANTLVVFTSDHGYLLGHHGLWHKGSGRWLTHDLRDPREKKTYGDAELRENLFEETMRVPFIVRWPNRLPAGGRDSSTITHMDWFPTLAALLGKKPEFALSGRGTEIGAITGTKGIRQKDVVFAQYRRLRMIRSGGWKLIRHFNNPQGDELYNLQEDPLEQTNLLHSPDAKAQAALERLSRELRAHMELVDDPELSSLR